MGIDRRQPARLGAKAVEPAVIAIPRSNDQV